MNNMDKSMKLAEMGKLICERNIRCRLESHGIPPMESNKDVKEKDEKLKRLLNEIID
jgi:hypothetical protein